MKYPDNFENSPISLPLFFITFFKWMIPLLCLKFKLFNYVRKNKTGFSANTW